MSVDDPYEFDPVIPDTSPEIVSHVPGPLSSTTSTTSRLKRTRDRYENMEARVAAMKEEFFEYRRRQKKRMESAC
jgi:phage shock protein A